MTIGWPLLGSARDLLRDPWLLSTFDRWAKEYGPIVQFHVFGQTMVVLSDEKIIHDLFAKRGDIYSDRGAPPAVQVLTANRAPAMIDRNDLWKRQRRMMHAVISTTENVKYEPFINIESSYTLLDILNTPDLFDQQLARYADGVVTRAGLGLHIKSSDDPWIQQVHAFSDFAVHAFRPDKYLCNMLPVLLKAPGWLFPEGDVLRGMVQKLTKFFLSNQNDFREQLKARTAPSCIQKHFIEHQDEYNLSNEEGALVFATFMMAGTRSPHNALLSFVINMLQHPEWMARLQQQVDEVVGRDRLPDFSDIPNLPVVRAIAAEVIRYRTVHAELGIPHKLARDDIYEGIFFAKGTIFHANYGTILCDPKTYPDGQNFNPARYLDPAYPTYKEPLTKYPTLLESIGFGIGRRACPGVNFTERTIVLMIARLGWAFKIRQKEGVELKIEYEPVANPRPLPFPAIFEARDLQRAALVKNVVERARKADPLL